MLWDPVVDFSRAMKIADLLRTLAFCFAYIPLWTISKSSDNCDSICIGDLVHMVPVDHQSSTVHLLPCCNAAG